MSHDPVASIRQVAFLGNYAPRRCGIATFTTDLSDAIAAELPTADCTVVAMNDPGMRHDYGERVRFEIAESDLSSYRRAADFLNVGGTDVLCVQHEYGIFGGKAGSHLLALLHDVSMPIVTTLHTLLRTPSDEQRQVLDDIARVSTRLVVMSRYGADLLQEVHGVSPDKIDLIPHGIPGSRPARASKVLLGLEGRAVILTFGLLSPDKGIEYVIQALPEIVRRHPNAVYVVVGATHPHVLEHTGDSYRRSLELLAHRLGVEANLVFHDRFVSLPELIEFLAAADIYVTPYLNSEQVASGTLAYAVGAGKAVVSTRYPYAVELLADGRGILVPNRDAVALGDAIAGLFSEPAELARVSARAAAYGSDMVWPSVAQKYIQSFERARAEQSTSRRALFEARTLAKRPMQLPELSLEHLRLMTDGTGILQHAAFATPRYADGYCLDDNARALMLMALIEEAKAHDPGTTRELASRYLAFVSYSFNPEVGRFRNFMSYDRRWREEVGSEDSQGRALWALGAVVGRSRDPGRSTLAGDLFHAALPAMSTLESPRAGAFALLGIDEYLRAFQGDSSVEATREGLADRLLEAFARCGHDDWRWGEDVISYDNARLPQALIVSGHRMGRPDMTLAGMRSLEWLAALQSTREGHFEPIGSNGFYRRGSERARFDQQPIEACAMVSACRDAWSVTRDGRWLTEMRTAFRWFLGHNSLQTPLYDSVTGGCRDGLHADRANQNQGAESTLSFLLALTELRAFESEIRLHDVHTRRPEATESRRAAE